MSTATLSAPLPVAAWPLRKERTRPAQRLSTLSVRNVGSRMIAGLCWLVGWVPLTLLGAIGILVLFLVRLWAKDHHDLILAGGCLFGLVLAGLGLMLVLSVTVWLRLRREKPLPVLEMETGVACLTGFQLGLVRWLPLLHIDVNWETPEEVTARFVPGPGGLVEEVTPRERAWGDTVVRRLTVRDIFGLARFSFRRRHIQKTRVLPACGRAQPSWFLEQFRPGDQLGHPAGKPEGDLIEMRRYVPGDPLKLVLWKVYARTGKMLVRVPERAVSPSDRMMIYLVAGRGDEPAAGILRTGLEGGCLGKEFIFGADENMSLARGKEAFVRTQHEAIERIVRSSAARTNGGEGLGGFLEHGESQGTNACLLFVPHRPGAWLERVADAVRRGGPYRAVVGVDGMRQHVQHGLLHRMFLSEAAGSEARTDEVREIVKRLNAVGVEAVVIDRITGETISLDTQE